MKRLEARIAGLFGGVAALVRGTTFAQGAPSSDMQHMDMQHSSMQHASMHPSSMHHSEKQMDQHVLSKMHEVNQMEMQMGQMAEKRGHSASVRDFGKMLRKEHAANDKKVTSLAHKEGIHLVSTTPMTSDERRQAEADQRTHHELMSARGAQFDRVFLQAMQEGHGNVAHFLTQARGNVHDGRVRALVSQTIPAVERHQRMAEHAESKL